MQRNEALSTLPFDIFTHIFLYLELKDLAIILGVSQIFFQNQDAYLKIKFFLDYPALAAPNENNWKETYKQAVSESAYKNNFSLDLSKEVEENRKKIRGFIQSGNTQELIQLLTELVTKLNYKQKSIAYLTYYNFKFLVLPSINDPNLSSGALTLYMSCAKDIRSNAQNYANQFILNNLHQIELALYSQLNAQEKQDALKEHFVSAIAYHADCALIEKINEEFKSPKLYYYGLFYGHVVLVKYLVERDGLDTNKIIEGRTPLIVSSMRGHYALNAYLLSLKVDCNKAILYDGTAIISALKNGHLIVVKQLELAGGNFNFNEIHFSYTHSTELYEANLILQRKLSNNTRNNKTMRLLYIASRLQHIHIVDFFLKEKSELFSANLLKKIYLSLLVTLMDSLELQSSKFEKINELFYLKLISSSHFDLTSEHYNNIDNLILLALRVATNSILDPEEKRKITRACYSKYSTIEESLYSKHILDHLAMTQESIFRKIYIKALTLHIENLHQKYKFNQCRLQQSTNDLLEWMAFQEHLCEFKEGSSYLSDQNEKMIKRSQFAKIYEQYQMYFSNANDAAEARSNKRRRLEY